MTSLQPTLATTPHAYSAELQDYDRQVRQAFGTYANSWAERKSTTRNEAQSVRTRMLNGFHAARNGLRSTGDLDRIALEVIPGIRGDNGVLLRTGEHNVPKNLDTTPGDHDLLGVGKEDIVTAYSMPHPIQSAVRTMVATEGTAAFPNGNSRIGYTLFASRLSQAGLYVPSFTFHDIHHRIDRVRQEWKSRDPVAKAGAAEELVCAQIQTRIERGNNQLLVEIGKLPGYVIIMERIVNIDPANILPREVAVFDSKLEGSQATLSIAYAGDVHRLERQIKSKAPGDFRITKYTKN